MASRLGVCGVVAMSAALGIASPGLADEPKLADYFGFLPAELYKLDERIGSLVLGDFDGDGTADVAVGNNARSRIDLLLSSPGPSEVPAPSGPNQPPADRRMRLKTVPVSKEVVSLQAGDFNGDGKIDLAYYGTPPELMILLNEGGANFRTPRRISTGEAVNGASSLAVGDLNRDGKDDLALLADSEVVTVVQQSDGTMGTPERLPHSASKPGILKIVDLDGDGSQDLILLAGGDDEPFRVRMALPGGQLGPEERLKTETPRAVAYADIDGKPGAEVLTIEGQSGRARVLKLDETRSDDDDRPGRLLFYPLPQGTTRGRSMAVGDLDGDKRLDVVATDPANAQFLVYRNAPDVGLGVGRPAPGLLGGRSLRLADLDGDGKDEVYVLSEQERQIGRAVYEGDHLGFPATLETTGGEPVALDVADLDGDGKRELLYVSREKVNNADVYTLRGLVPEAGGKGFKPLRWGDADSMKFDGLNGTPRDLKTLDLNGDGRADLLAFNPYGKPVIALGQADGKPPVLHTGNVGPLAGVEPPAVSNADAKGPGVLVAQNTFARSVVLESSGQWRVKEQYNSGRTSAQIQAAAALDLDADGTKEVVLLDRTSKSLLVLKNERGVFRQGPTLPIGAIELQGLIVADVDGNGKDDLVLAGADKFGVLEVGKAGRRLTSLASYEPGREGARLADLIAGDVNADGRPDVLLTDTPKHLLEITTYTGAPSLSPALSFPVFEQKSFRGIDDLIEPREIVLGDVDGDRRTDIVLLVHDRVIVYRQDAGTADPKAAASR